MEHGNGVGYYIFLIVLFIVIILSEKKKEKSTSKILKEFGVAFLVIFFIRSFIIDIFQIPSGSMVNNLLVGDIPIVKKYTYGYNHFSLWLSEFLYPNAKIDWKLFEKSPKRGDIFVFRLPTNPSINYVKRIVGLPGDKVQMIDGDVYINDKKIERKKIGTYDYDDDRDPGLIHYMDVFKEQFPGEEKPHKVIGLSDSYLEKFNPEIKHHFISKRTTQVYYVPKDHYFGLGDNRDFSKDCRYLDDVGFVHKRYIIGKVSHVLISMGHKVKIWEFWKWLQNFRYSRFFTSVK